MSVEMYLHSNYTISLCLSAKLSRLCCSRNLIHTIFFHLHKQMWHCNENKNSLLEYQMDLIMKPFFTLRWDFLNLLFFLISMKICVELWETMWFCENIFLIKELFWKLLLIFTWTLYERYLMNFFNSTPKILTFIS